VRASVCDRSGEKCYAEQTLFGRIHRFPYRAVTAKHAAGACLRNRP
jgi:hypothetical protein